MSAKMNDQQFEYFWNRPPLCSCGTVMTLENEVYRCRQCGKQVKLLAARANLAALNTIDLHKVLL